MTGVARKEGGERKQRHVWKGLISPCGNIGFILQRGAIQGSTEERDVVGSLSMRTMSLQLHCRKGCGGEGYT